MFYSQAGQDKWVLEKIPKGFFVDAGAHDGKQSSNTFALELAGWNGVCIEPNESAFQRLQDNRDCYMANVALHFYSGYTQFAGDKLDPAGQTIKCERLTKILDDCKAPLVIDYLSIDVEGSELFVLRGMDFNKYHVRMITIEHNAYSEGPERQQQIFEYLTEQGFYRSHKDVKCLDPNFYGLIYEDWYENINDKPKG